MGMYISLLLLFQASLPSLQDFYSSIPTLPAGWADQTTTTPLDTIQLCKVSRTPCTASQPLVVTCCVTINSDLTWQVHIHVHTITPTARSPLSSVPEKLSTVSATALLENHFSRQRASGGRCDNPTASNTLNSAQSLRVQGSLALQSVRGNCSHKRRLFADQQPVIDDTPLPKRPRQK